MNTFSEQKTQKSKNLKSGIGFFALWALISFLLFSPNTHAHWFPGSYQEAREHFLSDAKNLKTQHPEMKIQSHSFEVPSRSSNELYIDTLSATTSTGCTKILIMVSGTHGIEGFIGSGVQHYFLANLYSPLKAPPCLLMIHALNPYGFKNLRRVSENNIDLNRNFAISPTLFEQKNPGYSEIKDFLNPAKPAHLYWASTAQFLVESLWQIASHGMTTLRQSILQGQYEHEKGIFYGGKFFEPQVSLMKMILSAPEYSAPEVVFVDLHTGYGKRGQLHLLGERTEGSDASFFEKVYPGEEINFGADKNFYKVSGGLSAFVAEIFKSKSKVANLVFEYGTLDSQTTLGSMESLRRMILENQVFQYGAKTSEDQKSVKDLFLEMFYPQDLEWQNLILDQTDRVLKKALGSS